VPFQFSATSDKLTTMRPLTFILTLTSFIYAKLTAEQKERIKALSEEADKSIEFLSFKEIAPLANTQPLTDELPNVREGVWILLFGANW
jgi:hypothetical protein